MNYSYNQHLTYDANYIPIGTGWPFTPSNLNPTTAGSTSADIGSIFERTIYPGYGAITRTRFWGHANYNALTATVKKRLLARTGAGRCRIRSPKPWARPAYNPGVPNNEEWNYGRLEHRPAQQPPDQLLLRFSRHRQEDSASRRLGIVTDHWSSPESTPVQSGAPYNPGCSLTSGSASVTGGYTGTPDVGQRCEVIGNPLANRPNGNGQVTSIRTHMPCPRWLPGRTTRLSDRPLWATRAAAPEL